MKQVIAGFLKIVDSVLSILGFVNIDNISSVNKQTQIGLSLKYKDILAEKKRLPNFDEVQFRSFSQNGEDGILLYIFSLIGTTNKKAVEICAGDGIHCNSANLIVNHGWHGLLFDGKRRNIFFGNLFYRTNRDTFAWPPKLVKAWITTKNVNHLIRNNGFEGEIDLLSLDMDGVDYWIWRAIECIKPRVVVLEYQCIWGPKKAVTVPYKREFKAKFEGFNPLYAGASLNAFVKLAKKKGYRLVGCERYGFNAFFIRDGLGEDVLPEIDPSECFKHPKVKYGMKKDLPKVINKKWIKV